MAKRLTIEDAVDFVNRNSNAVLLETEWKGSAVPIRFRCSCGEEFTTTYNRFNSQNKRTCDACGRKEADAAKRLTLQEVVARIRESSDCEYVSGEYVNQRSPLLVRCSCGKEFRTNYESLVNPRGSGMCPSCGVKQRNRFRVNTVDDIRANVESRGAELVSTEYRNAHQPLVFRCQCGAEFTTTYNRFMTLGKVRCDKCSGRESNGEYEIRRWLVTNGIQFVAQKTFPGCGAGGRPYYFDFYLPQYNLCVEFDGEQHYRPVSFGASRDAFDAIKARDIAKDEYCKKSGIRLLRIPYWNLKDVDLIIGSMLIPR